MRNVKAISSIQNWNFFGSPIRTQWGGAVEIIRNKIEVEVGEVLASKVILLNVTKNPLKLHLWTGNTKSMTRDSVATIYWAHISSLHRYSRHYKFKLNFHERFHVHIQPQWIHVLILWSYHWKVNVKFIEQIQNNIFKWNTLNNKYINAFWHLVCCPPWPVSGYVSWLFLQA